MMGAKDTTFPGCPHRQMTKWVLDEDWTQIFVKRHFVLVGEVVFDGK